LIRLSDRFKISGCTSEGQTPFFFPDVHPFFTPRDYFPGDVTRLFSCVAPLFGTRYFSFLAQVSFTTHQDVTFFSKWVFFPFLWGNLALQALNVARGVSPLLAPSSSARQAFAPTAFRPRTWKYLSLFVCGLISLSKEPPFPCPTIPLQRLFFFFKIPYEPAAQRRRRTRAA